MKHVGITNSFMNGYAAGYIAALERVNRERVNRVSIVGRAKRVFGKLALLVRH